MGKYLSAKEAAALLGISPRTVFRWIEMGRLRPFRFGGSIRFSREQVVHEIEMQEYGRASNRDFALE
jgi:excisionase family DNA binding protein